jgi:hypothetical protein
MKKEVSQNLFILPSIVCYLQFCFLFVALFNSGYYFANKVLFVSFLMLLLWSGLFLFKIKEKKFYINVQNSILLVLFVLVAFYCIRITWFSHYLSIGAIGDFFKGESFFDILYHSTLAQSIVTNGYPSIQQNAPIFLFYHSLSHYIIAFISILLSLPCFITYNYIYPILVLPLTVYLIIKIIIISRVFFNKSKYLTLIDYFLISGVICSFASKRFLDKIGFFSYSYLLSESCLFSIIIALFYFLIIYWGYRRYKNFNIFNLIFLIPLFILGLSFAKISTGCIFFMGACYYVFRRYRIISFQSLLILFYLLIFTGYYIISGKCPATYPPEEIINSSPLELFSYVINYTKNPFYSVFHYAFFLVPVVLIYIFNNSKKLFQWNKPCDDKYVISLELITILALASCLPGLVMNIAGGSAFYFCIPVYLLIWILFLGTDTISKIGTWLDKKKYKADMLFINNKTTVGHVSLLLFLIVFLFIPSTLNKEAGNKRIYLMMRATVASRVDPTHFRKEFKNKIYALFKPAKTVNDHNYLLFNDIILKTKTNRKDYCLYIDGNSLINRYDYVTRGYAGRNRLLYGNMAVSAYLGLPIINSIYVNDNIFYRGDMLRLGRYSEFAGYSLPPIVCGERVSKENMQEAAKKIGKKKIIILGSNSYEIINVK